MWSYRMADEIKTWKLIQGLVCDKYNIITLFRDSLCWYHDANDQQTHFWEWLLASLHYKSWPSSSSVQMSWPSASVLPPATSPGRWSYMRRHIDIFKQKGSVTLPGKSIQLYSACQNLLYSSPVTSTVQNKANRDTYTLSMSNYWTYWSLPEQGCHWPLFHLKLLLIVIHSYHVRIDMKPASTFKGIGAFGCNIHSIPPPSPSFSNDLRKGAALPWLPAVCSLKGGVPGALTQTVI